MKKSILFLILPLSCALFSACTGTKAAAEPTATEQKTRVSYAAARQENVKSTDSFAVQMFRTLAEKQQGNVVFSPASVEAVLHLLKQGARGATAAELNALPMGKQGVKSSINPIEANALFIAETLRLNPGIKLDDIIPAPFETNSPKAVELINSWAAKNTKGLITNIVSRENITPHTRFVAANAIYLKAKWSRPFEKDNTWSNYTFTKANGKKAKVDMMMQTDDFRYAEGDDWQAVALFYRSENRDSDAVPTCFIGILPKHDARAFAVALTPAKYQAIRQALAENYAQETIVGLPRFDISSGIFSLKDTLQACGVARAFSPDADFRGFAAQENIMLSDVLQNCRAKIDEEGTEAAAVTVAIAKDACCAPEERPKPKKIIFNRPFIWFITDLNTPAAPYFMGLFEEPPTE